MVETIPEDIATVKLVWVLAILATLVMIIIFAIYAITTTFVSRGSLAFSIKFVDISNKPYNVNEILTHYRIDDRQLLEHAIESSVTGSLDSANSGNVKNSLPEFLNAYKFSYYAVALKSGPDTVAWFDSLPERCGDGREGFCIFSNEFDHLPNDEKIKVRPCGVGWVGIPGGSSPCPAPPGPTPKVCCAENFAEYQRRAQRYEIAKCGEFSFGVCSPRAFQHDCARGRIAIDSLGDCEKVNSEKTKICCMTLEPKVLADTGLAAGASMPLFYKDGILGELVVTVSE